MKQRVKDLRQQGDALFERRRPILSLWQHIAEQFYPERADFTRVRAEGEEFAAHLMTGAPSLARRDLANQFAAMLRPKGKPWFNLTTSDEVSAEDSQAKAWLEAKAGTMRRVMYDKNAHFSRATKEGDHDFAAFGQCALSVEPNRNVDGLLFRAWHLKDAAWAENADGNIDTFHLAWEIPARSIPKLFPKAEPEPKFTEVLQKEPNRLIKCRRIVLPSDEYDFIGKSEYARIAKRFPFVSIYIDCEHDRILEEVPLKRFPFVVPRWQTVSGSPYAHSPATVIALPDARLLQRITLTLLEAGEKAVNPPMVAAGDMIQGGVNVYAGGVTWLDADYDERTGEGLRILDATAKGNLAFGTEMADRYEALIKRAFYLDQLNLPSGGDMTATEVRLRNEEYIRAALPLFEPLEAEYNGALCDVVFNLCMDNGAFGNLADMPALLRGQEVKFAFESPLQAAQSRDKATAFQEASQLLAMAAQIDPDSVVEIDVRTAFRDALDGAQVPAKWITPDKMAQDARARAAQAKQAEQQASQVAGAAHIANQVGQAATSLQQAGLVPQAGELAPVMGAPV